MTMHALEASHFSLSCQPWALLARTLLLVAVLLYTATPSYAEDQQQGASIRSSILALDSARKTALQELEGQALPGNEESDYRDFIIFLNTRIINYCTELAEQQGPAALEDLPCPAGGMMTGSAENPPPPSEEIFYTTASGEATDQTQEEKTTGLEGDFLSALGEFDEMLLKEEEKVAARVPSQRESGSSSQAGTSGGSGTAGDAGSGQENRSGEEGTGDESGDDAVSSSGEQSGSTSGDQRKSGDGSGSGAGDTSIDHSVYGAPGGKLPPPEDDDIVARQLREAAEKEPDPELKKKLWEEYWKYKGVTKKGK
jgi:hypothetical protein